MSHFVTPSSFGDEIDGSPTFDGTTTVLGFVPSNGIYTINRPLLCNKLTVSGSAVLRMNNGSNTADFICARWLLVGASARISWDGNSASGSTAGAGITAGGSLNSASGSGGAGGSNAPGGGGAGSGGNAMGGSGGPGGNASTNGGGTGNTSATLTITQQYMFHSKLFGMCLHRVINVNALQSVNGSGGGGGGGGLNNAGTGVGGGGGSGGTLGVIHAGVFENYGIISSNGGKGADGVVTGNGVAGGGGGGAGGSLWIECDSLVSKGTLQTLGGLAGSGAGGGGSGSAGTGGALVFFVAGHPA